MGLKDTAKFMELFLTKAQSHLGTMNKSLLALEKNPDKRNHLFNIFRATHTLKGIASMMHYEETARLCHAMEDVFDALKKKSLKLEHCIDILFRCFDTLDETIKKISKGQEELATTALIEHLQEVFQKKEKGGLSENINVPQNKLLFDEQALEFERVASLNVKVEILDAMMNLSEELLIGKMRLDQLKETLDNPELSAAVDNIGRSIGDLQFNVMQSRMVPLEYVFDRFPRMVRDIAKKQNKEVDLRITGSDIELDRTVVDEIGESLVHLLRNAIDHGIETPRERRKSGKSPRGTITLAASRTKDFSSIEVSDDGAGLDLAEVKHLAVKQGILPPKADDQEVMHAVFSGVSTTKHVTDVSGRGFGLNIVQKRIESLGGNIRLSSEPKKGTTFTVDIPLTLAIIDALFVEVAKTIYAIPVVNVERLIMIDKRNIKGMIDCEAVVINGTEIPITRLDVLFKEHPSAREKMPLVLVRTGKARLGLVVDQLMATQEIVIKPLHTLARKNKYLSGSTIVGSGEVVSILDVANLALTRRGREVKMSAVESTKEGIDHDKKTSTDQ